MTTFPIIPYDRLPPPLSTHPYIFLFLPPLLIFIALTTRLTTTIRFYAHPSKSLSPPILPYTFPLLKHILNMASGFQTYIAKSSASYPTHPVFALRLGNQTHNMIISPSMIHQLLTSRAVASKVNMRDMTYRVIKAFWGDSSEEMKDTIPEDTIFGPIHDVLKGMMREEFVVNALAATVAAVENNISTMISGAEGVIDMERWERTAQVEIAPSQSSSGKGSGWTAEANLFALIRDFVGDLTTPVLMGKDFAANYPHILSDLWAADTAFLPLMIGLPAWLPHLAPAARARDRLVDAVKQHHIAYLKYVKGEDPGPQWGDMSDVSSLMRDRCLAWDKEGASLDVAARGDAAVLWAMNVNAPVIIFWMCWYIFADPQLLSDMRTEVAPYVKVRREEGGAVGGVREKQNAAELDLDGLRKKCPLLQGVFLETMRCETSSTSYKKITDDIVLEESEEDALIFGRTKDDRKRYVLKKGDFAVVPHSVHQNDPRYFEHPERFDARRFWTVQSGKDGKVQPNGTSNTSSAERPDEEPAKEEVEVSYKTMKPWGGGKEVCKGRRFAEGEVVLFVAAIVMFWDIEPADTKPFYAGLGEDMRGILKMDGRKKEGGRGGSWRHPGRKEGTGALQPRDLGGCRAQLTRREV